jgi:hypothetical protein
MRMIFYWVLTPIAPKHSQELENINILMVASLRWTDQANEVNGPNCYEMKPSSIKLNPTPTKGTQSHHPSLSSNLDRCDLSICLYFFNLLCFLFFIFMYDELWTYLVICECVLEFWIVMLCLGILLVSVKRLCLNKVDYLLIEGAPLILFILICLVIILRFLSAW